MTLDQIRRVRGAILRLRRRRSPRLRRRPRLRCRRRRRRRRKSPARALPKTVGQNEILKKEVTPQRHCPNKI